MDYKEGNLLNFINQLQTICFSGDDCSLSYGLYKQVVAIKSMNNYPNNEPNNPHVVIEQVKIKFEATKVIVRRFQNGTAALMQLLSKAQPAALNWAAYLALPADNNLCGNRKPMNWIKLCSS